MKKIIIVVVFVLISSSLIAQDSELSRLSVTISRINQEGFLNIVARIHDLRRRDTDLKEKINMYINDECENALEAMSLIEKCDFGTFSRFVYIWSYGGNNLSNMKILKKVAATQDFDMLFGLKVDWSMLNRSLELYIDSTPYIDE